MTKATCSVSGCDSPRYQQRQMCGSHFMKWYRYGDPNFKQTIQHSDLTGHTFGGLTALRRTEDGRWECACSCGNTTMVRVGDLNRGSAKSCGNRRNHYERDTGYSGAHSRVRAAKGSANLHACADCGTAAAQWSYNHEDPAEKHSNLGPFSADPSYYQPRCIPCHKRFDLDYIKANAHA